MYSLLLLDKIRGSIHIPTSTMQYKGLLHVMLDILAHLLHVHQLFSACLLVCHLRSFNVLTFSRMQLELRVVQTWVDCLKVRRCLSSLIGRTHVLSLVCRVSLRIWMKPSAIR